MFSQYLLAPLPEPPLSQVAHMIMTSRPLLALCFFIAPTFAQSNGMDMSMDMPMDLIVGRMLPYAHFTPGDTGKRT